MTLVGKQVLLGRDATEVFLLARVLEDAGAIVNCIALIEVQAVLDVPKENVTDAVTLVVLTSKNAIDAYLKLRTEIGIHGLAVVGEKTAETLQAYQITPSIIGRGKGTMDLLAQLDDTVNMSEQIILYPCSSLASDAFVRGATNMGAVVHRVIAYETVAPKSLMPSDLRAPDVTVFYSSSAVTHFFTALETDNARVDATKIAAVAIGESTQQTLTRFGVTKMITARRPDDDALFQAIVQIVSNQELGEKQ